MITMPDFGIWLLYSRFRKFAKVLALKTSFLLKPVLLKFLTVSILLHFATVKLRIEDKKARVNYQTKTVAFSSR